jgi:uncharacterized protein
MKCPVCSVEMRMTERQGIEVDYCPQCRGVWLDRGELDKIIERSARQHDDDRDVEASYPPEYRGPIPHQGGPHAYKHHKKKSLWREIFDFD